MAGETENGSVAERFWENSVNFSYRLCRNACHDSFSYGIITWKCQRNRRFREFLRTLNHKMELALQRRCRFLRNAQYFVVS